MPLPLDLHGMPERRVMLQLAEALIYEGLVDCAVSCRGGKCRFEWRHDGGGMRCSGYSVAFGRIRIAPETIEYSESGQWQQATLGDLLASTRVCLERHAQLAFE